MELASILVSLVLAMALIVMGLAKVQSLDPSIEIRDRLGVSATAWRVMGVIELVAAAGLILGAFATWKLALVSAAAAVVTMLVLLVMQTRRREPAAFLVPAAGIAALAFLDVALLLASNR